MTDTAYDRALDRFEALIEAPLRHRHHTPGSLMQAAGLPGSSGYRAIAALEADGFLDRDASGAYLRGSAAQAVGLRAGGAGDLASIAQPVLLQLRQSSHLTAFLGLIDGFHLRMGPFSLGRDLRAQGLAPRYGFETAPELQAGHATELSLAERDAGQLRRSRVLIAPVGTGSAAQPVIGVVLRSGMVVEAPLAGQVTRAAVLVGRTG